MTDDPVKKAFEQLQDIVLCRCSPDYTSQGLLDPTCDCDAAEALGVIFERIEDLELENRNLRSILEITKDTYERILEALE